MKAFSEPPAARAAELASSFSLSEKLAAAERGARWRRPDEINQADILTWGLSLAPAFPA
jgi:hypothetical protein